MELFRQIKPDYIRAVQNGEITCASELLPWLRTRIPSEELAPDTELGFSSAEEELSYAEKLANMLYNPISYAYDLETMEDRGAEVYFGDEVMSREQRDNLLKTAVSLLDENDSTERKLKTHLNRSIQAEENVGYMMLMRTQPDD